LNSAGTVYTLPGWFLPLEGDNRSRFGVMTVICVAGLPLAPTLERGLCGVSNKFLSVSVSVSTIRRDESYMRLGLSMAPVLERGEVASVIKLSVCLTV